MALLTLDDSDSDRPCHCHCYVATAVAEPAGKRVEVDRQPRSLSGSLETSIEVDRRSRNGAPAKRLAVEPNVGQFVFRYLFDELAVRLLLELGLVSTHHPGGIRAGIGVA